VNIKVAKTKLDLAGILDRACPRDVAILSHGQVIEALAR
jgi:hypothetical protein